MRIRSIRAFEIRSDLLGGPPLTPPRRPPWTQQAEVASPMSHHPRFKRLRSSWRPDWPSVGCLVTAQDGRWGFGMSRYGPPVIAIINGHLGPLLEGEPVMAIERLWDMMQAMTSPYAGGLSCYAISAIDLALWDLKGRILEQPVYSLIGGPVRDWLDCYATGNDTDWYLEQGFGATKLACPYGPADGERGLALNEALVAERRALCGEGRDLMLDCWMAFDVDYAVRLAERLRPYRLRWIEDCLAPEDLDGLRALRSRLPAQTLAGGEHWYTLAPFAQASAGRLLDIVQPDIGWAGGLTGCLRIAHLAQAFGQSVILHAGVNTPYGQHFSLAVPNCPLAEYFVGSAPGVPLMEVRLTPGMEVPVAGKVRPNNEPGFGLGLSLLDIEAMRPG